MKFKILIYISAALIGLVSIFLPEPLIVLNKLLIVIGFIMASIIWVTSSFRQHKHGVFAQWTDPKGFVSFSFSNVELDLIKLAVIFIVSPLLSILILLVIGN